MDEDSIAVEIRYMREDIKEMKQDIKDLKTKPCPQKMCQEHQDAITAIQTQLKLVAAALAILIPSLLFILDKVF